MSADNGIYILKTPKGEGYEYRVAHLQSIDDLYYNHEDPGPPCPEAGWYTDKHAETCPLCLRWNSVFNCKDETVHIENAREMWKGSVFTNESEARKVAYEKYRELSVCEYGICFIEINKEF